MDLKHAVKILHTLSIDISHDGPVRRAYSAFCAFKSLHQGGSVHGIKSNKQAIAKSIGIKDGKLRQVIPIMIRQGWAVIKDDCLVLKSFKKIKVNDFGKEIKRFHTIPAGLTVKEIEKFIGVCCLKEKLEFEAIIYIKKQTKLLFANRCGTNPRSKASKKVLMKQCRADAHIELLESPRAFLTPNIERKLSSNNHVTLTRKAIANLLGRKSAASGSRLVTWFVDRGWLFDKKNIVFVKTDRNSKADMAFNSVEKKCNYFTIGNKTFRRFPNTIICLLDHLGEVSERKLSEAIVSTQRSSKKVVAVADKVIASLVVVGLVPPVCNGSYVLSRTFRDNW